MGCYSFERGTRRVLLKQNDGYFNVLLKINAKTRTHPGIPYGCRVSFYTRYAPVHIWCTLVEHSCLARQFDYLVLTSENHNETTTRRFGKIPAVTEEYPRNPITSPLPIDRCAPSEEVNL
ncbi:hypothetical protein JTB14_009717 [Gonioctena quinquepunctata]|nr:hypothetical protein JTB14_009717 [Gonioctena quinquepunctata]